MIRKSFSRKVPNIRFNVAKGLEIMAPICGSAVCDSQLRPVLAMLEEDEDRDVRYFATKAIDAIDTLYGGGDGTPSNK